MQVGQVGGLGRARVRKGNWRMERDTEHLIAGQHVSPELRDRARLLRRRMTKMERLLWSHLRAHRFHGSHFRRQQVIGGYIADFYCDAAHLVVEVDGPIHRDQSEYDVERDRVIAAYGLTVIRVTNAEILDDLSSALTRIAAHISST